MLPNVFCQREKCEVWLSVLHFAIQPDGYVADNEENVDLSSLQAQIQKVRDQTKRHQKRKEEEIEESKNKIEEQKEISK